MAARGGSARPGEGPGGRPPQPPPSAPAPSFGAAAAAALEGAPRETVLGNCARCGSDERLKFCSRCQAVRYCSSDCQKADVRGRSKYIFDKAIFAG